MTLLMRRQLLIGFNNPTDANSTASFSEIRVE
jgi:hypothetical protein